ncbi:hypothetical protein [Kribbella shirazensis]|uniref:Uncharacterized protein n=1 Tax=Kribbella shirazensis TaxID=1105143 RepID=A0A7X5V938_9ACTN|nr:hypothetical protein [Kribbella shirazensis]NIK56832.1 hypothetical protein [Kribbella shirazensis]
MRNEIEWLPMAEQDLAGVGDRSVIAELLDIAATDLALEFLPTPNSDQGPVAGREPPVAWRRGIRRHNTAQLGPTLDGASDSEFEDWRSRACDYYLIYREPTTEEYAKAGLQGRIMAFAVVRVLHQGDLARMAPSISRPGAAQAAAAAAAEAATAAESAAASAIAAADEMKAQIQAEVQAQVRAAIEAATQTLASAPTSSNPASGEASTASQQLAHEASGPPSPPSIVQ